MPCENEKRRSNHSADADASKNGRHLDERDRMARRGDDGFQQRQLLADELMRCNDNQNSRACANIETLMQKKADAREGTTSGIANIGNCDHIFGEKAAWEVPDWCHVLATRVPASACCADLTFS